MSDDVLQIGDPAPDFTAASTDGDITLRNLRGTIVVLYFYPKDNTSGCIKEACAFRDGTAEIRELGATVLGVSRDSLRSHEGFRDRHELGFPLLSDADEALCRAYGVLKEKRRGGKTTLGIERSTFLIDRDGRVARTWRKVKVAGHVDEVIQAVRALASEGR